jgi:hypothetical protein
LGRPAVHVVQRGAAGNKIDTGLYVSIRELEYDGAKRWGASDHRAHTKQVSSNQPTDQDRELEVTRAIEAAWGFDFLMSKEPLPLVLSNPFPVSVDNSQPKIVFNTIDPGNDYSYKVFQTEFYLPTASSSLKLLVEKPVVNKWIYVLSGEVGGAQLEAEIYAVKDKEWHVRKNPSGTRSDRTFAGTSVDADDGILITTPFYRVKPGELYQFFLSPMQLNKNALSLLLKSANQNPAADPATCRPASSEQLSNVSVRRRYQVKGGDHGERIQKTVALIDPFAWVEQITFCDFQPVLDAQLKLGTNPNELGKQFISAVIVGMIETDDKDAKKDPLKLVGHLRQNVQHLNPPDTRNCASQWLDRHKSCMDFLEKEAREACLRVIEWMDSKAHRVVEAACQEELDIPVPGFELASPLSFGLLHYINVLRSIVANAAGQDFLARLYKQEKERIPWHNVLHPSDKKALAGVRRDIGGDPPLTLLTIFAPLIVRFAHSGSEASDLAARLKKIEVEAEAVKAQSLGFFSLLGKIKSAGSETLKLHKVDAAVKKLFPKLNKDPSSDLSKLLQLRGQQLVGLYQLLIGLKVYGEKASEESLKRFGQLKEKCEYPTKVLSFVAKQGKRGLADYAEERFGVEIEKWVAEPKYYMASEEVEKFIAAGGIEDFAPIAKYYKWAEGACKVFEGPVEFIFGVAGLVIQGGEIVDSWDQGDFGAAAGQAIQFGAALIGTVQGLMATYGLIIGAEVETGPLGWIAAVLTLIGFLVVWGLSENEIEKFVAHCFLGKRYGMDDGKASWTEGIVFRALASGDDRFLNQQKCLVNMLGAFKMWLSPGSFATIASVPIGGFVRPGYVPPGAKVEVLIVIYMHNSSGEAQNCGVRIVVDLDNGDYIVTDTGVNLERVEIHAWTAIGIQINDKSWGTESFGFFSINLRPKFAEGWTHIRDEGHANRFSFCVRLDVNGKGMYIPAEKKMEGEARKAEASAAASEVPANTPQDSSARPGEKTEKLVLEDKYLCLHNWKDVGYHHLWTCSEVKSTLDE